MNIIISNSDPRPIYQQVGEAIRGAIVTGELSPGAALPSIRGLAKDLRISVITTKRAFEELEREGYVETVPGKGSFVAGTSSALLRERGLAEIEDALRRALELSRSCGVTQVELANMLKTLSGEDI